MPKKSDSLESPVGISGKKRKTKADIAPALSPEPGSEAVHKLAPKITHHAVYDAFCEICVSPLRLSVERAYESESMVSLSKRFGFPLQAIDLHVKALNLDIDRLDQTDRMAAKIQEVGFQRLEEGLEQVTVDHLIRLGEHKDKKEGRIINRVAVTKPSVIVFRGIPNPIDSIEDDEAKAAQALIDEIDEQDQLLLPSSVKVVSETTESDDNE